LLAASGCVSLAKPYPEKELYALDAGRPAALGHAAGVVLRVAPVRVSSPFDAATFMYRTGDLAYEPDYYRGFVTAPEKLLAGEAVRFLGVSGPFGSVLDARSDVPSACSLETTVLELYGDYRDRASPAAHVRARFLLVSGEAETTRLLGDWTFEATVRLAAPDAATLARGLGAAWGEVLGQLATKLAAGLEASEGVRR
jgi:hypothetical protein